eukprot:m.68740 g.68740  ORF g.68740 m.68740 type:complete len:150 (-) comp23986_c1_seq3:160-609(-)
MTIVPGSVPGCTCSSGSGGTVGLSGPVSVTFSDGTTASVDVSVNGTNYVFDSTIYIQSARQGQVCRGAYAYSTGTGEQDDDPDNIMWIVVLAGGSVGVLLLLCCCCCLIARCCCRKKTPPYRDAGAEVANPAFVQPQSSHPNHNQWHYY